MKHVALALALLATPAVAQAPQADPDWPCAQRLVPTLGAAAYWGGPEAAENTGWREDPAAAALVQTASPRDLPEARGLALIQAYLAATPPAAREAAAAKAMEGFTDAINAERGPILERLRGMTRRQRNVAERVSALTAKLRGLPAGAPEAAELESRRTLTLREFDEVQRTIQYACEVPVALEARLGAYARALTEGQDP